MYGWVLENSICFGVVGLGRRALPVPGLGAQGSAVEDFPPWAKCQELRTSTSLDHYVTYLPLKTGGASVRFSLRFLAVLACIEKPRTFGRGPSGGEVCRSCHANRDLQRESCGKRVSFKHSGSLMLEPKSCFLQRPCIPQQRHFKLKRG